MSIHTIIRVFLAFALSSLIIHMGYSLTDWEPYAMVIISALLNIAGYIQGRTEQSNP